MNKKEFVLCIIFAIIGILVASWSSIWANEKAETIMAYTLFVSVLNILLTAYLTVEIALEHRRLNKGNQLSYYNNRFSTDDCLKKMAEWLIGTNNPNLLEHYNKKSSDDKSIAIEPPTIFEKERFVSFFNELTIQINNKQINKDDIRKTFSLYLPILSRIDSSDNSLFDNMGYNFNFHEFLESIGYVDNNHCN